MHFCIVGCGFFGATVAERIASQLGEDVLVVDKRSHSGGNCHSYFDGQTGIECHQYGSHIFHTSSAKVWDYLAPFTAFTPYQHKVFTRHQGRVYPMPINLATVNLFYGLDMSPAEAEAFLRQETARDAIANPRNLEEKAISLIGRPLYEAFIKGYTQKQWEHDPKDLPADIITRLPVRSTYNANYFNDPWQGVPLKGYGAIFDNMLAHPRIHLRLDTSFDQVRATLPQDCTIIYTGMLDSYFAYMHGELEWRSLRFDWETLPQKDFQGTTVMNYADTDVPFTRIHEFKHYHPERLEPFNSDTTVICREYSQTYRRGDEAYYPVNNARNNELYARYAEEAAKNPRFLPGGRLGCYKYWDMDKAVLAALELFDTRLARPRACSE